MGKKSNLVRISNSLTRAAYTLSLPEKRLLMLAVTKLHHLSEESQIIEITPAEYADFYSLHEKGVYRTLKNAADNLWTRTLVTSDNTKYRWIITSKYESGVIGIEFHPQLRPHLLKLKNQFTQYFLHRAANFKLMYTWRLFELIMQFKKTGYLKIDLDEFKETLDIPSAYDKDFGKIREKVIHPAVAEIREKDGLSITWKPIKTGRKVTSLEFRFPVEQQHELFTIDNAFIEKHAKPGESYETARKRLTDEQKALAKPADVA